MDVYPIKPVVRICGVVARNEDGQRRAIEQLIQAWGPATIQSERLPFDAGGYYDRSMGSPLTQILVGFDGVIVPDGLADWKHHTNRLESEAAAEGWDAVERPVNLDCGYVTEAKLVLATTKNRSHRIYLRDGMFAEITLTYVGGQWRHHDQTYPNYRTDAVAMFADGCRRYLRTHLHRG